MKKIFSLMIALVAMFAMSVSAQTLVQPKFIDNTYVRVEGGATALTHPRCMGYENWGHTIQGVIGAEVGKWITPKFGVAFEGDFGLRNGSKHGYFQYMDDLDEVKSKAFNYITVTGLAKWHVNNTFAGYNPNRKWEFVLATGPMWIHNFPSKDYWMNDFGVKFKAEINYNVTKRLQINVIPEFNYNLTGLYSYGTVEHPRFDSRNSWYALKVGVTYKIGEQFQVCDKVYTQAEFDALNAEINDLRARQPKVVEKVVEKTVPVKEYVVSFDYGSSTLDAVAKSTLDKITGEVTLVTGEASTPGSTAFNQTLSQNRADTVASYLRARGVKVNDARGLGETGRQVATVTIK